ncbi:hypothetical protein FSP39_016911 [Pinctada imbricata]|uniref:Uncharacterized protein n=1 Tax=Pinctada imbricata TaxID=66713 RepID=A0AA88YEQ0_PINIB|nr:hypothetical protein FSP39_016911 [Pinctada imbricata]
MSSAAAMAMASALTKSQQPTAAPPVAALGANTTGFGGTGLFGGIGGTTQPSGFGGFGTAGTITTQSGGTGGFFGGGAGTAPTIGFGSTQPANQSLFGSTPAVGTATPTFGVATPLPGAEAPFQLNKPPGKRGKR